MQNKKGNVAVIAIIVVIVAITAGVVGWMFAKNSQAPVQQEVVSLPAPIVQVPSETIVDQQAKQEKNESEVAEQEKYFISNELGIKFAYSSDQYKGKLTIQGNKIVYKYPDTNFGREIEIFTKKDTETVEEAILNIVKSEGKDIRNCKVINKGEYWADPKYTEYVLDLANPKISYTKQELDEIKLADVEAKKDLGPFDGEWKKQAIYNERLIQNCSAYADPLGLGTSKTVPSQFIYNNKRKLVFLPGLSDPSFYQEDSIELFD